MRRSRRQGSPWRRFLLIMLTGAVLAVLAQARNANQRISDRYDVKMVKIDISKRVHVEPKVAKLFPHGAESFQSMVDRYKPMSAINGTYYDESFRPLGDIVSGGKVRLRGAHRHAIAVTKSGEIRFIEKPKGRKFDWTGYRAGLACGPRLVHAGKPSVNPEKDGFKPAAKRIKAWRSAVGTTKDKKLLLVVVENSITLDEMAAIMVDLGTIEAMNLDGGGACGLYSNGKVLARPGLPMTNILAIYKD